MRTRPLTAALVAAALIASGCGGGTSDEDRVRDTVAAYREAVADKDYTRLCDEVLARALTRRVERLGLPCAVALKQYLSRTQDPELEVRSVEVAGDRARVAVTSSAEGEDDLSGDLLLVRRGAGWRIAELDAG